MRDDEGWLGPSRNYQIPEGSIIFLKRVMCSVPRSPSLIQAETHTLKLHCPVPTVRPFSKSLPAEDCFQRRFGTGVFKTLPNGKVMYPLRIKDEIVCRDMSGEALTWQSLSPARPGLWGRTSQEYQGLRWGGQRQSGLPGQRLVAPSCRPKRRPGIRPLQNKVQ